MSKTDSKHELLHNPPKLKNKLIYGVGVNNADYQVCQTINGKRIDCPFYRKWTSMLRRCYSTKYQDRYPTYKGCLVCGEWLLFINFKNWMDKQDWQGMHLDKDIVNPGNKTYSPRDCRFITGSLNKLLCDNMAKRGKHHRGVHVHKISGRYYAAVKEDGKKRHLGDYATSEQASCAYIKAKTKLILKAASEQKDPLIASGLRIHAELLKKEQK